jgi:hypothetical protein
MNDNNKIEKINQLDIYILQLRLLYDDINNFINDVENKKLVINVYKYLDIIYYYGKTLEKLNDLKNEIKGTLGGVKNENP